MRIGTVTFHCSNNYGAVLQSVALVEKLNQLGYDAKIIDYRPEYKTKTYNPFAIPTNIKSIKHILYHIYSIPTKYKIDKAFRQFNREYILTWGCEYLTSDELIVNPPDLDVIITGSDQVWNPESLGEVDKVYFLGFGAKDIKRVSYAPSFGTAKVDGRFREEISTYIKKLNAVSVREIEGKEHIRELTGIEAEIVLDPVFLLDKNQWLRYANDKMKIQEPYLLLYARERSPLLVAAAIKIAKDKNLKVVNISKILLGLNKYDENIFDIGPGGFLDLFRNASVVCTNSFHGTAFSIIFEKPFVVIPHRTRNTRIESILSIMQLTKQQVNDINQLNEISTDDLIHYDLEKTQFILNSERKKSLEFLVNGIETDKKDDIK